MARFIRTTLFTVSFAAILFSSVLVNAQTAAPIAEASLAVISPSNAGQLKLLGTLSINTFYGFSSDSKTLYYDDSDGKFVAWDLTAGKASATLATSKGQKLVSADGKTLTALNSTSIETWDMASGQKTNTVAIENAPSQTPLLSISPAGKYVGYEDIKAFKFYGWDVTTGKALFTASTGDTGTADFLFAPDDKGVLLYGTSGDMQLIDTSNGNVLWKYHSDSVNGGSVLFSPDGSVIAIVGPFGATELLNAASGKAVATLPGDKSGVHYDDGNVFSPDSKTFSMLMDTGAATAYDLTGKAQATIQTDTTNVMYANPPVFSPDGSLEALQIDKMVVAIADVASAKAIGTVKLTTADPDSRVYTTWFSPDRKLAAFVVDRNTIQLWGVSG